MRAVDIEMRNGVRYCADCGSCIDSDAAVGRCDCAPPTVAGYFERKLREPLEPRPRPLIPEHSPHHPDFHVETGCGADCKRAIDACAAFLEHHAFAFGSDKPGLRAATVAHAREIVRMYVYG